MNPECPGLDPVNKSGQPRTLNRCPVVCTGCGHPCRPGEAYIWKDHRTSTSRAMCIAHPYQADICIHGKWI